MPIIFSPKNAGKITGLFATCATIGGITAPIMTGIIVDSQGYNAALFLGAALSILGAVILSTSTVKAIVPISQRGKEKEALAE